MVLIASAPVGLRVRAEPGRFTLRPSTVTLKFVAPSGVLITSAIMPMAAPCASFTGRPARKPVVAATLVAAAGAAGAVAGAAGVVLAGGVTCMLAGFCCANAGVAALSARIAAQAVIIFMGHPSEAPARGPNGSPDEVFRTESTGTRLSFRQRS